MIGKKGERGGDYYKEGRGGGKVNISYTFVRLHVSNHLSIDDVKLHRFSFSKYLWDIVNNLYMFILLRFEKLK